MTQRVRTIDVAHTQMAAQRDEQSRLKPRTQSLLLLLTHTQTRTRESLRNKSEVEDVVLNAARESRLCPGYEQSLTGVAHTISSLEHRYDTTHEPLGDIALTAAAEHIERNSLKHTPR